ncbi:hypothetical protein QUF73_02170 [Cytobacillus sp. NJ13]|nr:hypothetical protein [Cytobacillus sp. NJ13]
MSDKRTIGLTADNRLIVEKLMSEFYFKEQIHVAKFGFAVAIKNDLSIGYSEGTDTIWNVGSFDSDGEIKAIITALYPEIQEPYRVIEYLYNKGIEYIGIEIRDNRDFNIMDFMD